MRKPWQDNTPCSFCSNIGTTLKRIKVNKVSDIIRTPFGVHIFKVVDKKPERKMSFEESNKKIHATLLHEAQEQAFHKWVEEIKKKSEIVIKYEILETF